MTKVKNGGASGEGVRINSMLSDTNWAIQLMTNRRRLRSSNGLLEPFDLGWGKCNSTIWCYLIASTHALMTPKYSKTRSVSNWAVKLFDWICSCNSVQLLICSRHLQHGALYLDIVRVKFDHNKTLVGLPLALAEWQKNYLDCQKSYLDFDFA